MALTGRPKKVRYIQKMPQVRQFSPRGKPGRPDEVILHIDEFEAFKLADFQNFSQIEGAQAMKLSRASFGRSLREARRKIADAFVNAKTIKIQMGDAQIGVRQKDFTRESLGKRPDAIIAPQISSMIESTQALSAAMKDQ